MPRAHRVPANGNQQQYDVLIFFTYLYATTVLGLEIASGQERPGARRRTTSRPHQLGDLQGRVRQAGGPLLSDRQRAAVRAAAVSRTAAARGNRRRRRRRCASTSRIRGCRFRPTQTASKATTRRTAPRLGPTRPPPERELSVAPGGARRRVPAAPSPVRADRALRRADRPGKGCEELIEYFSSYVKDGGEATLALMGVKLMALPEEPFIRFAGLLSDSERLQALEAATVVVCPSPYESLSLLALEALAVGTPMLANARSAVLVEHCVKSNGGLYYADRDEFVECLKLLVRDDAPAAAHGTERARLRPPELSLGRRPRQVRAALREDSKRLIDATSYSSRRRQAGARSARARRSVPDRRRFAPRSGCRTA